jgi:hypothetical protein
MVRKRKRTSLSISNILKITEKLQAGVSIAKICGEFHVDKQTVSDIKKNKNKVKQFTLKFDADLSTSKEHEFA